MTGSSRACRGTVLPCGAAAWLAEFDDACQVRAAYRWWEEQRAAGTVTGIVDLVPAARTVLVRFDPAMTDPGVVRRWLETPVPPEPPAGNDGRTTEVEVVYDGPDLPVVADLLKISPADLVRRHLRATWTVAFLGFAPGFAYLDSPQVTWRLPRRATSRTEVPAGSVALADGYCGIYPRASPGGWHLIGRTEALLWNESADPAVTSPSLLLPGTRVRFLDVG